MANNLSRILIEKMVRKTIKDIAHSPNRAIRNLVDMALHFSDGHFQKQFFQVAQTMLKNEKSAFYAMVPAIVSSVDTENLVTFGMNVGYNSFTYGAKKIREIEASQGFNVPWSILLNIDHKTYLKQTDTYHKLIKDGKELGIYTWQLFCDKHPEVLLPLIADHPDCAFILYCDPADLTLLFLDQIANLANAMMVIRFDEYTPDVYETLWDSGLLYSVYHTYTDNDLDMILSGDLFCTTQQMHPVFTALIAHPDSSEDTCKQIHEYIQQTRDAQIYHTIPWEVSYDCCYVDNIISSQPCSIYFDCDGSLYTMYHRRADLNLNLFRNDLQTILKTAVPKSY